jgi:hypothetical protein
VWLRKAGWVCVVCGSVAALAEVASIIVSSVLGYGPPADIEDYVLPFLPWILWTIGVVTVVKSPKKSDN